MSQNALRIGRHHKHDWTEAGSWKICMAGSTFPLLLRSSASMACLQAYETRDQFSSSPTWSLASNICRTEKTILREAVKTHLLHPATSKGPGLAAAAAGVKGDSDTRGGGPAEIPSGSADFALSFASICSYFAAHLASQAAFPAMAD